MGWEVRRGRRYYYQSERVGRRVVKRYLGSGALADAVAQVREAREEEARAEHAALSPMIAIDTAVSLLFEMTDAAMRLTLKAAGYRQHKRGVWRKKRACTNTDG